MPPLPEGFREAHANDKSQVDDPAAYRSKDEYLRLAAEQRRGTLAALASLKDEDLDKPAPEPLRHFLKTVCDVLNLQASHWLMHAGQWAVVRRKLGRKPLF
jgi:hypothetical protein